MRILAVILGIVVILLIAQDAFETVVLPRRVTRRIRITRLFYRVLQVGWKYVGRMAPSSAQREGILGYSGPLSLLALILLWAVLFVFGFALLLWDWQSP